MYVTIARITATSIKYLTRIKCDIKIAEDFTFLEFIYFVGDDDRLQDSIHVWFSMSRFSKRESLNQCTSF